MPACRFYPQWACGWFRQARARGCHRSLLRDIQIFPPWQTVHAATSTRSFQAARALGKGALEVPLPTKQEGVDIQPWLDRLEWALPPGMRRAGNLPQSDNRTFSSQLDAITAIGLIDEARRRQGHDLLLAFARTRRWRELVWLVSFLIDRLWDGNPINAQTLLQTPLSGQIPIDGFINNPHDLPAVESEPVRSSHATPSNIEAFVNYGHPLNGERDPKPRLGHQSLGNIWQSLGNMIIEDETESELVEQGILELIAVLHSRGIMPDSIYRFSPPQSMAAGSQPPTLHILSSQILNALSDAVWKARQEEAKTRVEKQGAQDEFVGPELAGSSYRVRVAGIKHEIWLELILWSCIHGGWIKPGVNILGQIMSKGPSRATRWTPMSWREMTEPLIIKPGEESQLDWEYIIKESHKARNRGGSKQEANGTFERTISSEVLSAYVDALISEADAGVSAWGMKPGEIVFWLSRIKTFLQSNNYSLESTSWDAVVQRTLESEGLDVEKAPGLTERILDLSSAYGDDERSKNVSTRDESWRPLAPFLVDGTAMSLGITHRVMSAYIRRGDFAGAFRTFQRLQLRTDENKKRSLTQFFREIKSKPENHQTGSLNFSSPYSRATYPALYPLLPVSVLAPFLNLITEVGALDFGKWLLASHDVDGPIIGRYAYKDPDMAPAIIRFLIAAKDVQLLETTLRAVQGETGTGPLPLPVFLAIIESQIQLGYFQDVVVPILELLRRPDIGADEAQTLVALVAAELVAKREGATLMEDLFKTILQDTNELVRISCSRIVATLMDVDDEMREICLSGFTLPDCITVSASTRSFNILLAACAGRHGSEAGKKLLCRFSPLASDIWQSDTAVNERRHGILQVISKIRPGSVVYRTKETVDHYITTAGEKAVPPQPPSIHITGSFRPDMSTIRVLIKQRLQELRGLQELPPDPQPSSPHGLGASLGDPTLEWCALLLKELGMRPYDIDQEVEGHYEEVELKG